MKKILLPTFTVLLTCVVFATAADAQDCRLEDGCDFDEDGIIDAYPSPTFGQYGDGVTPLPVVFPDEEESVQNPGEQDSCSIPEGCDLADDGEVEVPAGIPADEPPTDEVEYAPDSQSASANSAPAGEASGLVSDPSGVEVGSDPSGSEAVVSTKFSGTSSGDDVAVSEASTEESEAAPGGVLPDTGGDSLWHIAILGGVLVACGGILSRIVHINA